MNKSIITLFIVFFSIGALSADTNTIDTHDTIEITYDLSVPIPEKRSFDTALKERYQENAFSYDPKPKALNFWDRFKAWLADFFSRLFTFKNPEAAFYFVSVLLKTIAVIVVLIVVFLIVKSLINKEGQWIFGKSSDQKINYDNIEEQLHLVDFEKLIAEALENNQKRLAIRYYYLYVLKKMSDTAIIAWDIEKTNSDYLYEIKNENLRQQFAYNSYLYNYIWYGGFELEAPTFEKAIQAFKNTLKELK